MLKLSSESRNWLNRFIPFFRQYITVIGSVHLDIFGEFDEKAARQIDKRGKIFYSVGGGAYNVAANLTQHNYWVYLCTGLSKRSYISNLLLSKIKENRIDAKYVEFFQNIGESGHIAHRHRDDQICRTDTVVSCMEVENIEFDTDKLKKAIGKSKLIILDCNLSGSSLQQIVDIAAKKSTHIMVTGISESKIKRVRYVDSDIIPIFEIVVAKAEDFYEGFIINEYLEKEENIIKSTNTNELHEFESLKKRGTSRNFFHTIESNHNLISTICLEAKTHFCIIIDDVRGYWILSREHAKAEFYELSDLQDIPIYATNGVVHALLSAVAAHFLIDGGIDMQNSHSLNRLRTRIEDYVRRVININGSTVGAELTWTEETDSTTKILSNNFKRAIKMNIGKISIGIGAIIGLIIQKIFSYLEQLIQNW